jgi:zinc protease
MIALRIPRAASILSLVAGIAFLGGLAAAPASAIEIKEVKSPGGIEAWLVQDDTLPMISMSFAFEGGSSQDPAGKPGVANFVSGMLDEGAGDLDSQAFQSRIDEYSIRMGFDANLDSFTGRLKTLSENRDEAFRLLGLALTAPRFDQDAVERIRAQIASNIRSRDKDPESVAGDAWMKAAYPDHPYGNPSDGTAESIAAITADDLRAFHDNTFARGNLKIGVVGNIDPDTLGRLLDSTFGKLPVEAKLTPVADVQPVAGAAVSIDMAIPQTIIRFGGDGLLRHDPDFIPAYVANHILGSGDFSSRLYTEVREKRGLAYSVGTYLAPYDHSGLFVGGTATRADRADESLKLIESEIARFAKDGPTEDEVAKAKSYLIGNYPLRFDNSGEIAGQLLAIQLDNLGIDYINKRNDMIRAVTVDDVKRVAARLFGPDKLIVARVGQKPAG